MDLSCIYLHSTQKHLDKTVGGRCFFGVEPCGLSVGCLRLEGGLHLYGRSMSQDISLYEAGLGWIIKPEKGDFIGKEALLRSKENPQRKLVGFQMQEFGIPRHGFPILNKKSRPLAVTSGFSPTLNAPIGMLMFHRVV